MISLISYSISIYEAAIVIVIIITIVNVIIILTTIVIITIFTIIIIIRIQVNPVNRVTICVYRGDFMFLYGFVRHHRSQTFVQADNFRTTFQVSFNFGRNDGPVLLITWLDLGHFDVTLTLNFQGQIWSFLYICIKNGPIATKQKASISIELDALQVTIVLDNGHDLELEFSRSDMDFPLSQPNMVWLPRNGRQTHWLKSKPQM